MGNYQFRKSTDEPTKSQRYRPLNERKNSRFIPSESSCKDNAQQSSIDKYDYLIVFTIPLPSELTDNGAERIDGSSFSSVLVNWKQAEYVWKRVVPGADETKKLAVDELLKTWNKFGDGSKSDVTWKLIIKEAIVDQLSSRAGLQLQKTTVSNYVFCRVRAPIKLLEQQAKREGYRLQLRSEVDPGSEEFWNVTVNNVPVELEEDRKLYSKEEANAILSRLHRVGKISAMDMTVNALKENQRTWSRRVHVLERIADKVSVSNTYPAFTPFTSEPHLRYLFQPHTGVRGKTLLRAKDRLYLTKAIIDRYFDLGKLEEDGLITTFMPLHDANRGEKLTTEILQRRWSTFWRASATEVGSPLVTDESYHEDKPLSWYLRPFAQPLGNVREYMGEKVALHFAWLGCYTYNMITPTVLGTAFAAYEYSTGYSEAQEGINVLQVLFILFMVAWSVSYKENWTQQERAIALKWGTLGFEEAEKDRPQFKGDVDKPFERSVINNRRETYFPKAKRRVRKLISLAVVWVSVLILIMLVALVYYLEYFLRFRKGYAWGSPLCSLISAVQINVLSYTYGKVSDALNDWENHRTQTAFEDNLTLKTFSFEVFNSFAALTYTCFFKGTVFHICTNNDCISDLKSQLLTIYILRYVIRLLGILLPSLNHFLSTSSRLRRLRAVTGRFRLPVNESNRSDLASPDQQYLTEFNRPPHEGTYRKYAEVVLQYGYLVLFAPAWPLICVLSLVDNLTGMRVEAWRQCAVMRRPEVYLAEDVGMWTEIMDAMTVLGIYFNVAIFVWTGNSLASYSLINKVLLFFIASQALLMLKLTLQGLFGGFPQWILDIEARQNYIVRKYFQGIDDNESLLGDKSGSISSTLPDDYVDVDGLSLYDFRGDSKMTKAEKRESDELEKKRRTLQHDTAVAKGELEKASLNEKFNVESQMGETLDGSPLGLLRIEMKAVTWLERKISSPFFRIQVLIRGDDVGAKDRPELLETPDVALYFDENDLDLSMGPIAPIACRSAEVVFRLFCTDKNNYGVIQSAAVSLSALEDQEPHTLDLQLYDTGTYKEAYKGCIIHLNMTFLYSNIAQYRLKLKTAKSELANVERKLSLLKLGRKTSSAPNNLW